MSDRSCKVYLVGAGPGEIAYLTLRGQQLLAQAEVLIYDALVDSQLLQLVPSECLKLDVGKRGGKPSTPQAEINQLLVEHGWHQKRVVRLKSGDPLIFGRSSAEIQALTEAGCEVELVPGISSVLAAPLLAGIPLTDKALSSCFAVVSAHQPENLDWEALARMETLVFLMGGRKLEEIVRQLQGWGRSPSCPIAVIRDCGRQEQQVWSGTLADIVAQTAGVSLSPTVIVVGEVVRLRDAWGQGEQRSRGVEEEEDAGTRGQGDKGSRGAEEQKRKKTRRHGDAGTRGAAGHTDLRTEISRVGGNLEPRVLVSASSPLRVSPEGTLRTWAPGHLCTDTSAPASSSPLTPHSSLQLTGKTVLVTRSAKQSSNFTNLLQQQGATVIEMPAIEICPPSSWEELDSAIAYLQDFHWLILTSANGVEYFCNRLIAKGLDARDLAGVKIAVVGKKTAATLKKWGLQPDFIPSDFVADSLAEEFPEVIAAQKLLFPRVETGGREVLVQQLTAQGAEVVEVAAYQSGCPAQISPTALQALQQQAVDVITFASSKTVKNFSQLLEAALTSHSETNSLLKDVCIASIGPQTSHACRKCLGRCDIEAEEYTLEGLTQAVVQWVRNNSPNFEV